jgi:hypothetical protein
VNPTIPNQGVYLADTIPNPHDQSGPKLALDIPIIRTVEVKGAGNSSGTIDFGSFDFIYTKGLLQCFAVCAVWGKFGDVFQNGYLAHVSSPITEAPKPRFVTTRGKATTDPTEIFFATVLKDIPSLAWVVVDVGDRGEKEKGWGQQIAEKLRQAGHAEDHIWIYRRAANGQVGFAIDKQGRFGEV